MHFFYARHYGTHKFLGSSLSVSAGYCNKRDLQFLPVMGSECLQFDQAVVDQNCSLVRFIQRIIDYSSNSTFAQGLSGELVTVMVCTPEREEHFAFPYGS